jgi:uncharacterized protein
MRRALTVFRPFVRGILFLVALFLLTGRVLAETPIPASPDRFVTDEAAFLSPSARQRVEARLEAYQRGTGHQVLVWIGRTTGGTPLDDWAVRAFAAWKPGRQGKDDGLALFIMADDHRMRIEVGYGLEGLMPDITSSRILREVLAPRLRMGDRDGAVLAAVDRILETLGGDTAAPRRHGTAPPLTLAQKALLLLLGLGLLALVIRYPQMAFWILTAFVLGGRRGGGGGGDDGFSGGGGRSGGGGASDSW